MAEEMNQNPVKKQRMLSLIQPSGVPTLGNYLGALKNWKEWMRYGNLIQMKRKIFL